jgi:solute carrier family 25 carnitine/acylcarnitine transporter 20/29
MANWVLAIPADTIKSRIQSGGASGGFLSVARDIVAKEGAAALFKGLEPALVRAFPANAACFLGMEVSKRALDRFL